MTNPFATLWMRARATWTGPLMVLFGILFFMQVGTSMVWSMLAVYGASLGASASVVGLMVSAFGGARLLVNYPSGVASEKFGRRRMMRIGCVLLAASSFFAALSSGIPLFFVCLLVMGIGSSIFVTSALAAVVDLGTPGKRIQDMSAYQGANMIGISLGPSLGGLAAGVWSHDAPFLAQGVVAVLSVAALGLISWPAAPPAAGAAGRIPGKIGPLLRSSIDIWIMAFTLFYVRVSSNWILLPLLAREKFGLDLQHIGLVLTAGALVNFVVLSFTPRAVALLGRVRLIQIASVVAIAGALLLIVGDSMAFVWLATMAFGASGGMASPTLTAYVADAAPVDKRGPAMGLLRTVQDCAMIMGPMVTGLLTDRLGFGYQGGLLGCVILTAVAMVAFGFAASRRKPS